MQETDLLCQTSVPTPVPTNPAHLDQIGARRSLWHRPQAGRKDNRHSSVENNKQNHFIPSLVTEGWKARQINTRVGEDGGQAGEALCLAAKATL